MVSRWRTEVDDFLDPADKYLFLISNFWILL